MQTSALTTPDCNQRHDRAGLHSDQRLVRALELAKNKIEVNCETAAILVPYKGEIRKCIIDKEDVPKVAGFKWNGHPRGAITSVGEDRKRGYLMLARLIIPQENRYAHRYINGDHWDCRKKNLAPGRGKRGKYKRTALSGGFRRHAKKLYFDKGEKKWRVNADVTVSGRIIKHRRPRFDNKEAAEKWLEGMSATIFVEAFIARGGKPGLEQYKAELEEMFKAAVVWNERRNQHRSNSNLVPADIYSGNADYKQSVADIPMDDDGMWDGYQLERQW